MGRRRRATAACARAAAGQRGSACCSMASLLPSTRRASPRHNTGRPRAPPPRATSRARAAWHVGPGSRRPSGGRYSSCWASLLWPRATCHAERAHGRGDRRSGSRPRPRAVSTRCTRRCRAHLASTMIRTAQMLSRESLPKLQVLCQPKVRVLFGHQALGHAPPPLLSPG